MGAAQQNKRKTKRGHTKGGANHHLKVTNRFRNQKYFIEPQGEIVDITGAPYKSRKIYLIVQLEVTI